MASTQERPSETERIINEYEYQTPLNLALRWRYYELDDNPIEPYEETYKRMSPYMLDDDSIVDLGCFYGKGLQTFRQLGHIGTLIGVDIQHSEEFLFVLGMIKSPDDFDYISGDMNRLPLADNSVKAALSMFSLYHAADSAGGDPEVALSEITRIVEPGGLIAIATSSKDNKLHHREFENELAEYMSESSGRLYLPPRLFNTSFDSEIAEEVLPDHIDLIDFLPIKGLASVRRHNESKEIYNMSLATMMMHFRPAPPIPLWKKAFAEVVNRKIDATIEHQGVFTDVIDRTIYIGYNRKAA